MTDVPWLVPVFGWPGPVIAIVLCILGLARGSIRFAWTSVALLAVPLIWLAGRSWL